MSESEKRDERGGRVRGDIEDESEKRRVDRW